MYLGLYVICNWMHDVRAYHRNVVVRFMGYQLKAGQLQRRRKAQGERLSLGGQQLRA